MTFKDRVERDFARGTDVVLRFRVAVIALCFLVVGGLSLGLPRLRIETSFASYLPEGNRQQEIYRGFRERFGSGERVVILLRPPEIFDLAFLADLRRLHDALEENLPYLRDLKSLVNARQLEDRGDSLVSKGFLDDWPETADDLDRARERLRANPLYRNTVVSEDESATAIVIELEGALGGVEEDAALAGFDDAAAGEQSGRLGDLLSTEQSDDLVRSLDSVLGEFAPKNCEVYVAGTPIIAHRLGVMLTRDVVQFVALSLLLTAALLYGLFRNFWAMLHPLLVVGLTVVGTLGWMGLVGIPLTAVTEILPSLFVAIGVGDAVHIQAMFYKRSEAGDSPAEAIRWAMEHSGLAVLLTSLTTAASMAAFCVADLQPIIDLGRVAPFGVALALLLSITLLPALLASTNMQPHSRRARRGNAADAIDRILLALGRLGTRHPRSVVAVVGILSAAALVGCRGLHFSQDDLHWLPQDDPVRIAAEALNETMKGAEPLDLLVQVEGGEDLRDPRFVAALAETQRRASELRIGEAEVAQTLSVADLLEETHRVLGGGSNQRGALPATRELVSQELLLFESAAPEDLEELVSADFHTARVVFTVPFVDALYYPAFAREVANIAERTRREIAPESVARFVPTGLLMLAGETFNLLFASMVRSYTVAFLAISLLMLLLIGHLRLGILSILPNLSPILLVLGIMGWTDSPLDISSLLVGGILIGVVVDDTIHFVHNFTRFRRQTGCSMKAVHETLTTTGRAMLVTSIILSCGFFVFTGAWLRNVSDFGRLCGTGAILAFLADTIFMPAIIALAVPCKPACECGCQGMPPRAEASPAP